jgi:hypothetical protein
MRIKFTVGMSEAEEERLRLEEQRRQSSQGSTFGGDEDPEARAPGWPAASDSPDEEVDPPAIPIWAW